MDEQPIELRQYFVQVDETGEMARLILGAGDGEGIAFELPVSALPSFAYGLMDELRNTLAARHLGRASALQSDRSVHTPDVPTLQVLSFLSVRLDSGVVLVDLKTTPGDVVRIGLDQPIAAELREALRDEPAS